MSDNFIELINKFKEINNKGYIKGINNNLYNSAGLTFENLINKSIDNFYFPDYKDIEIKTKQRFSHYPITLFCCKFDGPEVFEANYIVKTYGINKNIIINLYLNEKILFNNYYFELKINYADKSIYINIYNADNIFVEKRRIIYFDSLKNIYNLKLKKLAVIRASKKKINNNLYFRYYKINCYDNLGFNYFLKAIENKIIKTTLMLRTEKNEKDLNKNKNKNLVFAIYNEDLQSIFQEIYYYKN